MNSRPPFELLVFLLLLLQIWSDWSSFIVSSDIPSYLQSTPYFSSTATFPTIFFTIIHSLASTPCQTVSTHITGITHVLLRSIFELLQPGIEFKKPIKGPVISKCLNIISLDLRITTTTGMITHFWATHPQRWPVPKSFLQRTSASTRAILT